MELEAGGAVALSIAGSDPTGGAGLQADLKTFAAHGVVGATVVTALTVQDTLGVRATHPVAADVVRAQLEALLADLPIRAAKTGLLAREAVVEAVVTSLRRHEEVSGERPRLVVDPVMSSHAGVPLLDASGVTALRGALVPLAELLTPNLPEAAALLGWEATPSEAWTAEVRRRAARELRALGARAVLLKGGHGPEAGAVARDLLVTSSDEEWLEEPWVETVHAHGTGCALSAAVTARLARGAGLREAVVASRRWLTAALRAARPVGRGRGWPDHLHAIGPARDADGEGTAEEG